MAQESDCKRSSTFRRADHTSRLEETIGGPLYYENAASCTCERPTSGTGFGIFSRGRWVCKARWQYISESTRKVDLTVVSRNRLEVELGKAKKSIVRQ